MSELGVVLAGGASTRFGSPKGLARVGGRRILDRVLDAVRAAADTVVLIANDPGIVAPVRTIPDDEPGRGPIGGILTALRLAREEGSPGVLCVGCDMPFVSGVLLRTIVAAGGEFIVVPESRGRRGFEPLCAWYPAGCAEVAATARAPHELIARFPTRRIHVPGDPEILFFNVNTREDLHRAEQIA